MTQMNDANQAWQQWPMASLLPHAGNMILLDHVCHADDDSLTAQATVKPGPYSLPDGALPPWLGLELMAQAVGAWAGYHACQNGTDVQLGFLLGTRRYEYHGENLPLGATFIVTAQRSLIDASGMAVFECTLRDGSDDSSNEARLFAQARLTIYQPSDAAAFVASA